MCLAVPVKVIKLQGDTAIVEIEGVQREAIVSMLDDLNVGDHILIHAGFAIQKWDQEDVADYEKIMQEMKVASVQS